MRSWEFSSGHKARSGVLAEHNGSTNVSCDIEDGAVDGPKLIHTTSQAKKPMNVGHRNIFDSMVSKSRVKSFICSTEMGHTLLPLDMEVQVTKCIC